MAAQARIGLDNPAFSGRLRQRTPINTMPAIRYTQPTLENTAPRPAYTQPVQPAQSATQAKTLAIHNAGAPTPKAAEPITNKPVVDEIDPALIFGEKPAKDIKLVAPEPFAKPGKSKQQRSAVLQRQSVKSPFAAQFDTKYLSTVIGHSKAQKSLFGMAVIVFAFGMAVSISTIQSNNRATSQVSALSAQAEKGINASTPSSTKPTAAAYTNYAVAPDLARYIKIPKLGLSTRVLQTGAASDGKLNLPENIYDAAWYTGSAKPGLPGVTLINGQASNGANHGAFYAIKDLTAGDTIQVQKGDNSTVNYKVVKSQVYSASNNDTQAMMQPATNGKPGLNLTTSYSGQSPKTLIVFAEQV